MTKDLARAVIFGRDADTYERSRPSYPKKAVDHIQDLVSARTALEIGAGTGKATEAMARPGLDLTCLEPSTEMAGILVAKRLPGVSVVVSTFEAWDGPADSLDLIYAAQAWHWVDHDVAYRKTLDLLRPGGVLALMWNIPHERYEAFQDVYAVLAPELLVDHDEHIEKRDSATWLDEMKIAGFEDVRWFVHDWTKELDETGVRELYSTYSDHMMLEEEPRRRLLDGLGDEVRRRGGHITLDYRTSVFSGVAP